MLEIEKWKLIPLRFNMSRAEEHVYRLEVTAWERLQSQ